MRIGIGIGGCVENEWNDAASPSSGMNSNEEMDPPVEEREDEECFQDGAYWRVSPEEMRMGDELKCDEPDSRVVDVGENVGTMLGGPTPVRSAISSAYLLSRPTSVCTTSGEDGSNAELTLRIESVDEVAASMSYGWGYRLELARRRRRRRKISNTRPTRRPKMLNPPMIPPTTTPVCDDDGLSVLLFNVAKTPSPPQTENESTPSTWPEGAFVIGLFCTTRV